ncbi:MAG: YCF48-related protein [Planctomycetota bacterium]|nr:YCF48-related protein [Planctomycetota bacterium]
MTNRSPGGQSRRAIHWPHLAAFSTLPMALILAAGVVGQSARAEEPARSGTLAAALLSSQGKTDPDRLAAARRNRSAASSAAAPAPAGGLPAASGMMPGPIPAPGTRRDAATQHGGAPAGGAPEDERIESPSPAAANAPPGAAFESRDPIVATPLRQDARLHDVCFVDPHWGWAVGDRGTIWHTEDGGRSWALQETGAGCTLYSVEFLNRRDGCAVGGYAHPYTHSGTGVVLSTRDGGRTWRPIVHSILPILKKVRFFNEKQGWAIGCSSAAAPSGLFVTDSGGRSWNPLPGGKGPGWNAGDLLSPHDGALAGQDGAAAEVRSGRISPAQTPQFGLRGLADIRLVPPYYGWLIGDGGLLMLTRDLGHTWQTPPATPPANVSGQFDFRALAVRGTRVWIAGSPGTRVLFTPDAGMSWQTFNTGQTAPLRAIQFVDDLRGWAVGDFGTILATEDGGKTWRRQRAGGTRAALLAVFAGAEDLPLELVAKLSGEEGYLAIAEIVGRGLPEAAGREEVAAADRAHEAMLAVGGSGAQAAWRFPLHEAALRMSPEAVIGRWNQANDGRGAEQLEAHLVRQIRTFRPEILITHEASPTGSDPAGHVLNQAVLIAVRAAGDPTAYPDQITSGGLEPWAVTRVFGAMAPGLTGTANVTTSQLSLRLGKTLADAAATPRGLIDSRFRIAGETLGFRLLVDQGADHGGREDFFTGIILHPGGDARRELHEPPARSLERMRRIAQRSRNIQAILEQAGADSGLGLGLLAQAEEVTRELDQQTAARVLHHMAQAYFVAGQWPLAASMFEQLARRYPASPLARSASTWLVQYYASGEAAWRVHGRQRLAVQQASARAVDPQTLRRPAGAAAWEAGQLEPFAVRQASAPSVDAAAVEDRSERAAALGKTIQQAMPDLYADPKVGFPLAVADRKRGYPAQAERFLMVLQRSSAKDDWWACAQGERWMSEPAGMPPKQIIQCAKAPTKPHLDGRLDDAVWQRAKAARLAEPDAAATAGGDGQTSAMLAYDADFLYLAVRCRRAAGVDYAGVRGVRPRDPDLSQRDRVELFLDLDRDFTTYYRLAVDHRGFAAEDCWGDRSWDPTWFVAAGEEAGSWTAEAAIPLDQLTGSYPQPRSVWAIGLRRIIPGVGLQSWSMTTAGDVRPEQFGYLIFN